MDTAKAMAIHSEFGKYAEDVIKIESILEDIRENQRRYWQTHKKVVTRKEKVDKLFCADLKAAKMFAEAFGYKYEVQKKVQGVEIAIYYKDPGDIGTFENYLSDKWAVAVPVKNGYDLVVYQPEKYEVVER